MKNNKKAFTIVELVIVIAVIAILAAVLIPTFSNLIEQANKSTDEQLCRNYNTILATEKVFDNDINLYEAINAFEANGFNAHNFETNSKTYVFSYDKENAMAVLLNRETGAVEYPATYKSGKLVSAYPKDGKSFIKGVYEYMLLTPYVEYNPNMRLEEGEEYTIDCNKNVYDMGDNTNNQIKVTNGMLLGGIDANIVTNDASVTKVTNEIKITDTYSISNNNESYSKNNNELVIDGKTFYGTTEEDRIIVGDESDNFSNSSYLDNINKIIIRNCTFVGVSLYTRLIASQKFEIIIENNKFINCGYRKVSIFLCEPNVRTNLRKLQVKGNTFYNTQLGIKLYARAFEEILIENNVFDLKLEAAPKSTNNQYTAAVRIEAINTNINNVADYTKNDHTNLKNFTMKNNNIVKAGSVFAIYYTVFVAQINENSVVDEFASKFNFENNTFNCDKVSGYKNSENDNYFEAGTVEAALLEAIKIRVK